ncbi:RAQPRD family integrative conjugative element protein [Stenotrophomonas sp. NLF4-10]|uniref:integrative conjugative element protein, RAQPRD family n=1 Tax=Stenotrophomonas sp. NLF4-10 TaxID=2918754 RepID=UPI001EFBC009|nr:RAQPRD family integrative conjugative element protein [Stenotrophomonas sp. NLF4-10]MCG8277446.1 RAQPRD family integrative conjugative element protein [Stenotrophomonas sp. NLF4-10]
MQVTVPPIAHWRCVPSLLLALCIVLGFSARAHADDASPEHARLAAALRQLDAIDRLIAHEATRPRDERTRYHFDYGRLSADLERVRDGIHDYLTPSRAQPRDPSELAGDYRTERVVEPLTTTEGQP